MTDDGPSPATTLNTARLMAGGMAAGVLFIAALSGLFEPSGALSALIGPAALFGLVSPVLGYRLYLLMRERVPTAADTPERCRTFLRATLSALSITEAAALFGVLVFVFTAEWYAAVGVATHILLTGALWPTQERLGTFLETPDGG